MTHTRILVAVASVVLVAAVLLRIADPTPIARLRDAVFDSYLRQAPRVADPSLPVRVVAIDEPSLAALGQPSTRGVELALQTGVRDIGVDIVARAPRFVKRAQPAGDELGLDPPPLHACPDRRFDKLGQRLALAQHRLDFSPELGRDTDRRNGGGLHVPRAHRTCTAIALALRQRRRVDSFAATRRGSARHVARSFARSYAHAYKGPAAACRRVDTCGARRHQQPPLGAGRLHAVTTTKGVARTVVCFALHPRRQSTPLRRERLDRAGPAASASAAANSASAIQSATFSTARSDRPQMSLSTIQVSMP